MPAHGHVPVSPPSISSRSTDIGPRPRPEAEVEVRSSASVLRTSASGPPVLGLSPPDLGLRPPVLGLRPRTSDYVLVPRTQSSVLRLSPRSDRGLRPKAEGRGQTED